MTTNASSSNNSQTDNNHADGEVFLKHRFHKKGESISLHASCDYSSNTSAKNFLSSTKQFDSSGALTSNTNRNQQSSLSSPAGSFKAGLSFTYPIKKSLIADANYTYTNSRQQNNKTTYNYDLLNGRYDQIDTLTSNYFTNTFQTQSVNIGLNSFGKSFRWQAGLGFQYSHQYNRNEGKPGNDIEQKIINWFPRTGFFYTIDKFQHLNFNYMGNSVQPTIGQLAPIPDFSNPLLVHKGNPDLKPAFDHNFFLNYNLFSRDRLKSFLVIISS